MQLSFLTSELRVDRDVAMAYLCVPLCCDRTVAEIKRSHDPCCIFYIYFYSFVLEREHKKILEDHEHAMELAKEKHESQLNFARKEHQLTITKNNDTIMSLEQQVIQLKQALKDVESQRQRQVRELEQSHKQDRLHADNLHDKKVGKVADKFDCLSFSKGLLREMQWPSVNDKDIKISISSVTD